jgi:prephenate dehydrogenase
VKVLVVGAGLIGSSIGLALKHAGHTVGVHDNSERRTEEIVSHTLLQANMADPDVVVVAVPTADAAQVISENLSMHPTSTVIDVASVKTEVINEVEALIGKNAHFVPTHPMSGKETSGAESAAYDLFQDRIWVITPLEYTDKRCLETVKTLVADCGSLVIEMDPTIHDQTVAMTSHIPQIVSSVLAGLLLELQSDSVTVSGQGLRDMTRLAASNASLWAGILSRNSNFVHEKLSDVIERLVAFNQSISRGNVDEIISQIQRGNEGRKLVPGKHGAPAVEYSVVPILIDDKPGQLAAIFASAGKASINIEDVRIDHSLGKAQAVVELMVSPSDAVALIDAMRADNWVVRSRVDSL